jgi:hypothetical protein
MVNAGRRSVNGCAKPPGQDRGGIGSGTGAGRARIHNPPITSTFRSGNFLPARRGTVCVKRIVGFTFAEEMKMTMQAPTTTAGHPIARPKSATTTAAGPHSLLDRLLRRPKPTLYQRCLAVHIASTGTPGALR